MKQKIKTAILGYGRSGSTMHAGAIENIGDFEMTAVCDIDPERQKQAVERFGCRIYSDYKEMLSREELDIVCVVTRSDQHCDMTCDCLEAGTDVLVTKPWAVNAGEGERMRKAEEKSGRRIFPWLPARWGSDLKRLRELLEQGAIGNPFMIRRTVVSFGVRDDWQTEKKYGGGYILNWGPHILDPPILLAGSPAAQVYGKTGKVNNPGDGEDFFFAL
ncbi:MAG: Gfo/Idh/MocA family protein, partial [Spirochaetia bacterium]